MCNIVSMPSPSRSNFTRPAAAESSLSHWSTDRPSMRAHSIGQNSSSGRSAITMPPEWMPRWRGKSITSAAQRDASGGIVGARAEPRGPVERHPVTRAVLLRPLEPALVPRPLANPARSPPTSSAGSYARLPRRFGVCESVNSPKASGPAAQRSTHLPSVSAWPGATPAAFAISRSAERGRYVITLATCAARSRP